MTDCLDIDINKGFNIIGITCPQAGYSAHDLLSALGGQSLVKNVQRYNRESKEYDIASYAKGEVVGVDFPVVVDEAYVVNASAQQLHLPLIKNAQLFPPALLGISPGSAAPEL